MNNLLTVTEPLAVADRLRPVLVQLGRGLRKETAALGITAGQASLLRVIREAPGIGLRELAELEGVSGPAMSGSVDRLETLGFVRRRRSDEDRRRVGLEVTPAGARVLRAVRSRRTAWLSTRLGTLSPAELEAVEAAIEPLQRLLGEDG
jgi:DNA-binding MarR family transcriptional regulator